MESICDTLASPNNPVIVEQLHLNLWEWDPGSSISGALPEVVEYSLCWEASISH